MEYWKNQWKNSFEIPFLFLDGHLSGDFKETNIIIKNLLE